MFFTGTLQEALASAVQSNKAVVCFVTDEGEESKRWESEFLAEDEVAQAITSGAVALRLRAGSQEAGYLAAIFPLPKIPTVVILRNGELKEYLPAGTSQDDFSRRVLSALGAPAPAPQPQQASSGVNPANTAAPTAATAASQPAAQSPASAPAASASESTPAQARPAAPAQSVVESDSSGVQTMMAERAARLDQQREEAKKKALEAYAKAKAKGKEKADPDSGDKGDSKKPGRNDFVDSVRRKQREATEERKRILKRIEDDKVARKDMAYPKPPEGVSTPTTSRPSTNAGMSSDKAAILVRLSDGSTLRNRFAKRSNLRGDVRRWVDSNRKDGSTSPYKFRVALNPTASRLIDDTEEDRTLEELGLAPSATLVLVPVPSFVTANAGGGVISGVSSFFLWLYTMITTFFTSLIGRGPGGRSEEIELDELNPQGRPGTQREKSTTSGVNTLQDSARQRRDHQLYNGNSLNFEPRPDDEDDER